MIDTCPTWPTLLAWLENDLPDEESQLLNKYVADCPVCREKLAVMTFQLVGSTTRLEAMMMRRNVAGWAG